MRQDKIILNNYIKNDPLSEENLDKTLDLVNEFRLSCKNKSIWLYTGYKTIGVDDVLWGLEPNIVSEKVLEPDKIIEGINDLRKRSEIISKCDVLIDGQYMESQRNITLPWVGSANQRVIDIQKSLQKGKIVLWQT